ncbi:17.3 kDa class II heat shock protein-like [Tasmannia lanceolata]|uniref:17.3 kDa class II heat shock protein-like n=1 Tax=Tasmannia lanceolata TaxID=3420 RepID=UPI0040635CD0
MMRITGLENPLFSALHQMLETPTEQEMGSSNAPARAHAQEANAMASTPTDVIEYPDRYVFVIDMPGVKITDIKVRVEDKKVLVISGERKKEEEEEAKYVRMERRVGNFMRKFVLPDNANTDEIVAVYQNGVLIVTIDKVPPPEPKEPKNIDVK